YQTLFECLLSLSKMMSPIAPFMGEWLYQRLNDVVAQEEKSVHISFYPAVEETAIDKQLEQRMELARTISSMVLRVRNQIDINVRQPLSKIILPISQEEHSFVDAVKEIILDEVNVKKIEYVNDDSDIVSKTAKPNFPILGKRLGKKMKAVTAKIKELSSEEITAFEEEGIIELTLDNGESIRISSDELEIQRTGLKGWSVESEKGITVAVDTELTTDLIREGLSREFVNRIQNMRKEADFEVTDRIKIGFSGSDELQTAVTQSMDMIKSETLSEEIQTELLKDADFVKTWEIEGQEAKISIRRTINN
ncbi:MAG: DUF5915 domain-containing protein, partial [Balneolaceae bacterium]